MEDDTADEIVRGKAAQFLRGIANDLRNRDEIRHAAARLAAEIGSPFHRLAAIEREHLGDPDAATGIYAAISAEMKEPPCAK